MDCFYGMVDQRKAFSVMSNRNYRQRSSPSRISATPQVGFRPVQDMSSDFDEWSCAVVKTTTPRHDVV